MNEETGKRRVAYDFDAGPLLVHNFGRMAGVARRAVSGELGSLRDAAPEVDRTVYVVDPASGDGGVQWVNANRHTNPHTRRDIEQGRYPDLNMEVPYNGDAEAPDLVSGYWTDVRQLVARRLNAPRNSTAQQNTEAASRLTPTPQLQP